MIIKQHKIEIGEVCCELFFEDGFFEKEFSLVLSDYRRWGFYSKGNPEISIVVKNGLLPSPSVQQNHIFYHCFDYNSVQATLYFDTKTFKGEIGINIIKKEKLTPVRIIEIIETFICNAYLFYFFLHNNGTFIHSCGITDGKNGYIFAGPRREGKSTIAKLSYPRTILCDELVLLKKMKDGKRLVFGTPFFGDTASINKGADCKGIYFISKSNVNIITPVSKMTGALELIKEGVIGAFISINDIQRIYPVMNFFNLLLDLLDSVPCYKMEFKKDNTFWKIINEG